MNNSHLIIYLNMIPVVVHKQIWISEQGAELVRIWNANKNLRMGIQTYVLIGILVPPNHGIIGQVF